MTTIFGGHLFLLWFLFNPQDEHKQLAVDERKFLIELNPLFLNKVSQSLYSVYNDIQFASYIRMNFIIPNPLDVSLDELRAEVPQDPKRGVKKNSEGKNVFWFGYKGHLTVGTSSQYILQALFHLEV